MRFRIHDCLSTVSSLFYLQLTVYRIFKQCVTTATETQLRANAASSSQATTLLHANQLYQHSKLFLICHKYFLV